MADINNADDIAVDVSPLIRVYKDGRVERICNYPYVPPSPEDSATGVSSKDITVSPNISVRVYLPKLASATQKLPILVYYHGGGFCVDSAFSSIYHHYLNILVSQANVIAVSVEYRLAPEHPLPAGYEDCWEALQWVASHASNDGQQVPLKEPWLVNHGDFEKIFVGGDSAGGNIVHNVAIRAGNEPLNQKSKLLGGILSFPYFWSSNEKGGEQSILQKVWDFVYPTAKGGIDNPMIYPMAENAPSLAGLRCSKLHVCVAEKDELREISLRYVEAVKKSGWKGEIEVVDVEGEEHCFPIMNPGTEKAKDTFKRIASFIQD
ncbi:PREDICTED: 2-hydroxyisoflavanone dehydratase-like [Ipomoea nil]|uniref:2-hydroxyisoflavanone dehydratase-like n=1 Tax=Ipomoea nil TaxID=35883 RepID=UPI00090161CD|nr:PREDICTED: 2-hydroxyisoflavanone dehydratase-like [Ipomoea nil]